MRKSSRLLPSGRLCPIELPTRPFALYGIDHVSPINPISHSGNKYLIVTVDYFTKLVIFHFKFGVLNPAIIVLIIQKKYS